MWLCDGGGLERPIVLCCSRVMEDVLLSSHGSLPQLGQGLMLQVLGPTLSESVSKLGIVGAFRKKVMEYERILLAPQGVLDRR